jgi:GxxExxY protein
VRYENQVVGSFSLDLLIESKVVVEVKAAERYAGVFEAQLLNYLKATGLEVGLIINFGPSVEVKRMVL